MELLNFDVELKEQLIKMASIALCSNTTGQLSVELMVNPPKEGDPSYHQYIEERSNILNAMKRKAGMTYEGMNSLRNV